jgi:hypothetical protein
MFIGENIDVDLVHASFATNVNGILALERVTRLYVVLSSKRVLVPTFVAQENAMVHGSQTRSS